MSTESRFRRALAEPRTAMAVLVALVRGSVVRLWYRLTNRHVMIGPDFRAYCWLRIRGPGTVKIGRNVSVSRGFQRIPTIITHRSGASVAIGDGCDVSGARVSCTTSVAIGDHTLFASTTISDTDFIPSARLQDASVSAVSDGLPIVIGRSCWLGTNSFILRGCRLEDSVVVAAGAVAREMEAHRGTMLIGNPARQVKVEVS